jgi:hypothetical protein
MLAAVIAEPHELKQQEYSVNVRSGNSAVLHTVVLHWERRASPAGEQLLLFHHGAEQKCNSMTNVIPDPALLSSDKEECKGSCSRSICAHLEVL